MTPPYGLRRLCASLLAAALASLPLAVFLFPVTVVKPAMVLKRDPTGTIPCFNETELISFRPLWRLDGLPADATGLVLQLLIVLSLCAGVWALYPAFRPPPRA